MDPKEFIILAGKFVASGPGGARSAVSRAYYGAFHIALDFLEEFDCGCPRGGKAHSLVPMFLDFASNQDARRASRLLSDLHHDRIKADYHLRDASPEGMRFGQTSVESANRMIELLNKFRSACKTDTTVADFRDHVAKIKNSFKVP